MITVKEVKTKKEQREFLEFPLKLYKNNPYFVPPLYMDEKKIFRSDYAYYDTCEAVYYLAQRDGMTVGRISGILQRAANEKNGEKRIRFTRFDTIDDHEVSEALFGAVEAWGRSMGMDAVCGPLGFSDLEREGLLIDGFDQLATFEEQYNAPYYSEHIERLGYVKEVDWYESRIRPPQKRDEGLYRFTERIMKKHGLRFGSARNVDDFINRYGEQFFRLLDRSYDEIYGTVPISGRIKQMLIDNFRMIVKMKYLGFILNEQDEMICFALCFPSLSEAVRKSDGKLTPAALVRLLRAINRPSVIDFGLIGVAPEYRNYGIGACMIPPLIEMLERDGIEHAETNLNLEDNMAIRNFWKRFDAVEHKKRRSYVKKL